MKKAIPIFAILLAGGLTSSRAQENTWIQKANIGGGARKAAVSFSIGSKGYTGAGFWRREFKKDFWEYDPSTNAWTQKANVGGGARTGATGFSIGSKGYVGLGNDGSNYKNDLWEYDPATNTWTQKANYGGLVRDWAIGFSIGSKGYIGTGSGYKNGLHGILKKDFWEYDPATDTWTEKADFGGLARYGATGFSIGSKGYVGLGYDGSYKKDFWEYDPATNIWTAKADFAGAARAIATGFTMGNKGYIGTGNRGYVDSIDLPVFTNDFWEYDPATDTWSQKSNFGGTARTEATGFSIGSKGYIGAGYDGSDKKDFWEYTSDTAFCAAPTNLSVTQITSTTAKLKWDAVAGAEKYKFRYKISNTNEWIQKNTISNSKTINGLSPGTPYRWEVKTYCQADSPRVMSDWSARQTFTTAVLQIGDASLQQMQQISFHIYPNPAEDHATIHFTLPQSSHICIKVYDASGKEMATSFDGNLAAGRHSELLNIDHFSKGVYVVRMISDSGIENQRLIVQ